MGSEFPSCKGLQIGILLTLIQLEFVKDKATKEPFDPKVRLSFLIQEKGLEAKHAVSLYGCSGTVDGIRGDHLVLAPPYITSKEEIDILVNTLVNVLQEIFASL